MGTVLAWLLKPSNLIIVILAVLLAVTWFVGDVRKHKILSMETEAAKCEAMVKAIAIERDAQKVATDECGKNIEAIRASNDELQVALEKSQVYRKKWKEVTAEQAELPPPKDDEQCLNGGKIDEGHKAIMAAALNDLANYYSLRRKIKHPDAAGDSAGSAKVLPPAAGVAR